jgi:hypothetical protein
MKGYPIIQSYPTAQNVTRVDIFSCQVDPGNSTFVSVSDKPRSSAKATPNI